MTNSKRFIILILSVVAILLAVMLYKKNVTKSQVANVDNINEPGSVESAWAPPVGTERTYLASIKSDSSEAEKKRHFLYAESVAKEAEFINVTACDAIEPMVLKIKLGDEIKFKNDSSVEVKIGFNPEHSFVVPAKSTKSITADLGMGVGLYGFGCKSDILGAGMVLVEPKL